MRKKCLKLTIIVFVINLLLPLQLWAADSSNSFQVPFSELNFGGDTNASDSFEVLDSLPSLLSETPSSASFGIYEGTVGSYASLVPSCNSFTASQTTIESGESVLLSWNVSDALNASINQSVGAIALPSGSISVSPTTTTSYVLTAQNGTFQNQCSVTVTVTSSAPPPAAQCLFFVAEPAIITLGQITTLKWFAKHAVSGNINQSIGAVTIPSGTRIITPANNTTYTLTLSNGVSDITCQAAVAVNPVPVSSSAGSSSTSRPGVGGATRQIVVQIPPVSGEAETPTDEEEFFDGLDLVQDDSGEQRGAADYPSANNLPQPDFRPEISKNADTVSEVILEQSKSQSLLPSLLTQLKSVIKAPQKPVDKNIPVPETDTDTDTDTASAPATIVKEDVKVQAEVRNGAIASDHGDSQSSLVWYFLLLLLVYIIARQELIITKIKNTLSLSKPEILPKKKVSNKGVKRSIKKTAKKRYTKVTK